MSGKRKRKRKLKSLSDTNTDSGRAATEAENENLELQTWSDLPTELLESILSRLSLDDNVRASVVCKSWHSVATAVCVVIPSPWLMYFPKFDDWYEFYDPVKRKTYSIELSELSGARVCYTKDGWLLLYRPRTHSVFFFNPFTQEIIKLPRFEMSYQIVAFSCAPTSSDCILFTVKHVSPTVVAISTCYPGATKWTTISYQNRLPFVSSIWNKLVFCNGLFYCLSLTGWLGVFDLSERTWNVLSVPPPKCPDNFFAKNWWKGKFMIEHEGDIIVIYTCSSENPIIFKLDKMLMEWEEMTTLDGVTLFASFLSSHSRTDLPGIMRNSVYFSKVRFYGKRCISFSLDDYRYYPRKQCHDWGEQDPFENIWVEPPKDFAGFT
ncbi:F-box/kelch-repeat protein At1g57790 [Cajanus cajan]|nr:F-box/kelch-repeat protein At1g57790 [Cajanus cajan]XP_020236904.1 F-box/kelch-repeat protein At1g57790 [Cajanus cajan]XP_020236905.1 F-box/kelch-repeat protein At1g57790 [Cajanus cajan]